MMKIIFLLLYKVTICCILVTVKVSIAKAQELPVLDEILITSPLNDCFLLGTASEINVLDSKDILRLNANSLPEILETIAHVNIVERGTPGSQSDIRIKGSSFEEVLLLINGIRINDPQTGHFIMDIPVDLSSIERIEVMSHGGASIYGSYEPGLFDRNGGISPYAPSKRPILSPSLRVTIAFFQEGVCLARLPKRRILPGTVSTLTSTTCTLKAFSTAFLIWYLLASLATSKLYLFWVRSIVFFSVITGRLSTSRRCIFSSPP